MPKDGSLDLLNEVEENLATMKEMQQIRPVKVKSILEHLRSSLEYVANDTYDKYVTPPPAKRPRIYFPYGDQSRIDKFFTRELNVNPPSSSPLYEIFNSIQDFRTGDNAFTMMCNLTNEVKHRKPIPLEEDSTIKDVSVNVEGLGLIKGDRNLIINFKGNYLNGERIEDFTYKNGILENIGNGIPVNIVITEEKKIRFHGIEYEVIPFIEICLKRIRAVVNEAYEALDDI
ncbi:hypothetical protein [Enterobacter hormaechei]|uniref:hypothetical protein n=1 Tax=Enterobacter hormaechei TaxID=158836 RepID=UPI0032B0A84F